MAKTTPSENLLDFVPIPCVDWKKQDDGSICLRKPKLKNPLLLKLIRRMGYSSYYHIHLDDFGTFVWERMNGQNRILDIAESLKAHFGEHVEPVYDRLGTFIRTLAYQKLIRYQHSERDRA